MDHQQGKFFGNPYSEAHSFLIGTQNDTIFMPQESRHHNISGNTKFAQIRHRELSQPKAGKTTKISQSVGKLPTTVIRRTTFAHRVFLILTMSFRKAYAFSKRETSSTTRLSRFVKSLSELIGIRTGKLEKTIPNAKNSLIVVLPEAAFFCTEVRIMQGQFHQKFDSAGFPQTPGLT